MGVVICALFSIFYLTMCPIWCIFSADERDKSQGGHMNRVQQRFYTPTELSKILRVSRTTLKKWRDAGILTAYTYRRGYMYAEEDIAAFLTAHKPPDAQDIAYRKFTPRFSESQIKNLTIP